MSASTTSFSRSTISTPRWISGARSSISNCADAGNGHVFLDMGDQFIGLFEGKTQTRDEHRHFGLVVDDRSRVRDLARAAGAEVMETDFLDLRDPWGNRIQVVDYADLQFSKTDAVLRGMGLDLKKSQSAQQELEDKGMG